MSSTPQYVFPSTCITHNIVGLHKSEIKKILRDVTKRPPPPADFRQITICSIGHPQSPTNFTIDSSELQYTRACPEWKTESKAVPPHDLYYDKLITMRTPYIRALDLEKLFNDLANSIPNVPAKDLLQSCDADAVTWSKEEIWKVLQPIVLSKEMSFANQNKLKDKMMRQIEMRCKSALAEIRNAATQFQAITRVKEEMIQVLIRESKTFGYYVNRCGETGEVVVKQSIHNLLSKMNIPSLTLSGFRVSKYLGASLARVGITLPQDAEMDTAAFIPDGDKVNINFVQTKVLLPTETEATFEEKLKEKIEYSLKQCRKDLVALLAVLPDISAAQLDKIIFGTFSALPVTARHAKICSDCEKMIIFHDDLNPTKTPEKSPASTFAEVLKAIPALPSHPLATKLALHNIQTPTPESLELYKTLAARFIGVSSVHPTKNYSTFLGKQEKQFEDLEKAVKKEPQRALFLTPQQNGAIQNHHFMLAGPFGSGKTTVLELCLQNILYKYRQQNPHIFVVIWDDSQDLLARFQKFKSEGVHVFGRKEIFRNFGIELDESSRIVAYNQIIKEIKMKFKVSAMDEIFILTDEMNPNPVKGDPNNMDWRGIDTSGTNVILSVKPLTSDTTTNTSSSTQQLLPPASMPLVRLDRVLRSTQSILHMVHAFFQAMQADSSLGYDKPNINFSLDRVTPGSEIHGEKPELVLLPKCTCLDYCKSTVEHFLRPHRATLEAILARMVTGDNVPHQDITVLLHTVRYTAAAKAWLVGELGRGYSGVRVKLVEEFRGMESPVLVYVGDGGGGYVDLSGALEGMTRVTSRLIIVHKEVSGGDGLSRYLPSVLRQGLAVDATDKYKQSTGDGAASNVGRNKHCVIL